MPGATPQYPPELNREAIRLVVRSSDRFIPQIAKELGVLDNSLRSWVKQFELPGVVCLQSLLLHLDITLYPISLEKLTYEIVRWQGFTTEASLPLARGKLLGLPFEAEHSAIAPRVV